MEPVTITVVTDGQSVDFVSVSKYVEFQKTIKEELGRGRVIMLAPARLLQEELQVAVLALMVKVDLKYVDAADVSVSPASGHGLHDVKWHLHDGQPVLDDPIPAMPSGVQVTESGQTVIDLPSVHNVSPLGQIHKGQTYVVRSEMRLTPAIKESIVKQLSDIEAVTGAKFIIFDSNMALEELDRSHPLFGQLGEVKKD